MNHGTITLRSGTWTWSYDGDGVILLRHAERSGNEMRIFFPNEGLSNEVVARLARDPDVRVWTDDDGVQWQVSTAFFAAGRFAPELPDSPDQPDSVTLEFDRDEEYRAVKVPITLDLGDLTHQELQDLLRQAESQEH